MIVLVLPDDQSDDILLTRARNGDKHALGVIYERYVEPIYQFVRLRVGDETQAEDITSTVFAALLEQVARGKGPDTHLRGWLFQVARHHIYDSYGEQPPLPLDTLERWRAPIPDRAPEQHTLTTLSAEHIRQLIQQLTPDQQEVLLLRFDQHLSLQEVADIMGKNVNTVKSLQLRAVQALRRAVERSGIEI